MIINKIITFSSRTPFTVVGYRWNSIFPSFNKYVVMFKNMPTKLVYVLVTLWFPITRHAPIYHFLWFPSEKKMFTIRNIDTFRQFTYKCTYWQKYLLSLTLRIFFYVYQFVSYVEDLLTNTFVKQATWKPIAH
jgi:hypothetical protein